MTIGADADIRANMYSQGHKIALADGVRSATIYGKITNDSYGGASCYADGLAAVTYQVNGADYATQILRSGSTAARPPSPPIPPSPAMTSPAGSPPTARPMTSPRLSPKISPLPAGCTRGSERRTNLPPP